MERVTNLECAFFDCSSSGIKQGFSNSLGVELLQQFNYPLANTLIGAVLEFNIELNIPLNVKSFIWPLPLSANLPLSLADKEIEVLSLGVCNDYRQKLTIACATGSLNIGIIEELVDFLLYGLNSHTGGINPVLARTGNHTVLYYRRQSRKVKEGEHGLE